MFTFKHHILLAILIHFLITCNCSIIKTCSFDSRNETILDFQCMIQSAPTNFWKVSSLPNIALRNFNGKFAILEKQNDKTTKASLSTTQFSTEPFGCISFWYLSSNDKNKIEVEVNSIKSIKQIQTTQSDNLWTFQEFGYSSNETERNISITVEVNREFVAIDEINISDEPCQVISKKCTFSEDFCSFHSPSAHKWEIERDNNFSREAFTSVNFDGMQFNADLFSTIYPASKNGVACIDFKYLFKNPESSMSKLELITVIGGVSKSWWSSKGDLKDSYFFGRQMVRVCELSSEWRLLFRVNSGAQKSGFVALTDLLINPTNCDEDLNCNFESGTCLWEIVKTRTVDENNVWRRKTEETFSMKNSSTLKLPDNDVTLNSSIGSYMFFTSELYNGYNDSAAVKLRSQKLVHPLSNGCFTFWVHTNSAEEIGSQIQVTFTGEDSNIIEMESTIKVSELNKWSLIPYNLVLSKNGVGYFEIEVIGNGKNSSIAIDDINLYPKECEKLHFDHKIPDISHPIDSSILNCGFDHNSCNYIVPSPFDGDHFNWKFVSDFPGPGKGFEGNADMFLVSSNLNGPPAAPRIHTELISPLVISSATCSLSFYLSTHGDFDLRVVVNQGEESYEVWFDEQSKSALKYWWRSEITISPTNIPFRIDFVSKRNDGFVAIDQLKLGGCIHNSEDKKPGTCTFEKDDENCKRQWDSPLEVSSTYNQIHKGPTRDADLSRAGKMVVIKDKVFKSNPFLNGKTCSIALDYASFNSSTEVSLLRENKEIVLKRMTSEVGNYEFKKFSWTFSEVNNDYVTVLIRNVAQDSKFSYSAVDNTFFSPDCLFLTSKDSDSKPKKSWTVPFILITISLVIFASLAYFGYKRKQSHSVPSDRQPLQISYSELTNL